MESDAMQTICLKEFLNPWLSRKWCGGGASAPRGRPEYVVDASGVEPFDTRVLGALLVLRDQLGLSHTRLSLINLDAHAVQVLRIANFDKLFHFDV